LYDFKYQKEFRAEDGEPGRSQKQFGKDGKDLFIRIPVGVIVADLETQTVVDMDKPGMKLLVARGGRGGKAMRAWLLPLDEHRVSVSWGMKEKCADSV